jgi:hypothetical protein
MFISAGGYMEGREMQITVPDLLRAEGDGRLREYLKGRTPRQFAIGVAMTDAIARAVQRVSVEKGMDNQEVIEAIITSLVSFVQMAAPPDAWSPVGTTIAEQILRRLMIAQD